MHGEIYPEIINGGIEALFTNLQYVSVFKNPVTELSIFEFCNTHFAILHMP